ncbi:GTPase activating protein gyp3 [Histoplasma capsulatum G186AR]|uniref:GTPase activating protein gyp3 n=2 Tax=Ajellomyces capsulatus TaxID=5037 RepID=C0NKT5_AJECG|nr:GTPase activating protein gyp3 [Histoplasma capsulatum G186AR]EEH08476.1 GTPase activating protein gyp3 [Histoplasma capsulatum G186AR]KAG5299210.1 GTPase activating protein gyp3 [Histoplasma capsulatum]QSS68170.1 GTPase activating protein gyp3 [Histoplasma capsulatum G186AR]
MVTQNGNARYHPPDSRNDVKGPQQRHGAFPHPLTKVTTSGLPQNGPPVSPVSPYRAYQPGRSPTYQPTIPEASSSHLNMANAPPTHQSPTSHTSPTYRSPTYQAATDHDSQSSWLSRNEMERRRPALHNGNPRIGLKSTASTSSIRPMQHSQFRLDQLPFTSGPAQLRFPPHYHPPDVRIDSEIRSSSQSALTASSAEPTSGTERSSIVTKNSSVTDLSPEEPDIDGGWSVEDAISLYLNGFTDDPPDPATGSPTYVGEIPESLVNEAPATGTPMNEVPMIESQVAERQRSMELQEAINSDMAHPEAPIAVEIKPIHASFQRQPMRLVIPPALPGIVPPPRSPATSLRDQYGFQRSSSHISPSGYDTWFRSYSAYQETRKQKWEGLLKEYGLPCDNPPTFPPKSAKVKRYIRRGIPPEYRGAAWFYYAGGYDRYHRFRGRYHQLVEQTMNGPSNDDKEHIERDLHRTFPDNIHFKPDPIPQPGVHSSPDSGSSNPKYLSKTPEAEIIQSLRRVLYAFAAHNPKIGYTQSLNFIAGMLLLFLPEEKAFWMLDIITSSYLPGTHEISLEGANIDLWILMVALKDSMPAIYTKVASTTPTTPKSKPPPINTKTRLPDITLGLTSWLMSLYIGSLPLETTLRVWDVFFYEGSRTFFRVALAIFKSSEKEILSLSDPMEIFQVVQSAPKKLIDASALVDECFTRRFRLTQARVEELRAARRTAIREEKDRLSMLASRGNAQSGSNGLSTARATTPLPTSWRNLKHTFK